ncbi:hypothetical protein SAPIO_CDS5977 [Scedosporium apiospermum]|uniref:Calponin-homology (CH) domain-containing protein n=1 Tax=Pseudallescheria apiosperma TaxID=563466 RepID=A0A084G5U7_PSEDA|nr:uncharacterized protein SAPIO_CDS5977 [Scedosporium apiospermum]KEZ42709.1 hypothetical protein SAPIO_CDS5977 [Scedosporium apiospermum]
MGESRQELVSWLNQLLQLNITKVEQCGTGAALCQVFDSIFMDVPMSRVKFNVNSEYAYIQNFKVLQSEHSPNPNAKITPAINPSRINAINEYGPRMGTKRPSAL